jgi:hypothetical protein
MRKGTGFLLSLVLLALAAGAQEVAPLTNQDVLKMVKAGLTTEAVVAKIREAPRTDFHMERDNLSEFYKIGVSHDILQAMFERGLPAAPDGNMMRALGMEITEVSLKRGEEIVPLSLSRGLVSTGRFGTKTFINYPGMHAQARTGEKRPVFLVRRSSSPVNGHCFLVRLDLGDKEKFRSLRRSSKVFTAPDSDRIIPYEAVEEREGLWRVAPKQDLGPGEYGWYFDLAAGPQGGGILDFGVD